MHFSPGLVFVKRKAFSTMLVFVAGLLAYVVCVVAMPFEIALIDGLSTGRTPAVQGILNTSQVVQWAVTLTGALLLTLRAFGAVRNRRNSR